MPTAQPLQTQFNGVHCDFIVQRFPHGIVVLRISGVDTGELGDAPMLRLDEYMQDGPVQLFIDARNVRGASIEVSAEWAKWLAARKQNLRLVSMLPGSRFIEITAAFVRRFAELQGMMRIYTNAPAFDAAVEDSTRQD
ncbi:MAG TPA: hypothetical protein VGG46_07500 [Terriglobales bacterium]|jgi:hypothetical protein